MSHLLNDHPDWPNAMTTPTPRTDAYTEECRAAIDALEERFGIELVSIEHHEIALRELAAARAELAQWREAVLNELIVAHIYTKEHDTDQKKAIQDAITWNCQVALDPAVSSDARALIAQERERAERAEEACKDHLYRMAEVEGERDSLKRHAEAMAKLLRALNNRGGLGLDIHKAIDSVIDVYRAAFPKEEA